MSNIIISNKKVKKLANEIITAVEFYLGGIKPSLAKEIIKYGTYCTPYRHRNGIDIVIPSDKITRIYRELCELMMVDEFKIHDGIYTEYKVMPLVQNHFNYDIGECIHRGGLALHLFELKSKNKI